MLALISNVLSFIALLINVFAISETNKTNLLYGLESKWDKLFLYFVVTITIIVFIVILAQLYGMIRKFLITKK